jgi:hypothetical protein
MSDLDPATRMLGYIITAALILLVLAVALLLPWMCC